MIQRSPFIKFNPLRVSGQIIKFATIDEHSGDILLHTEGENHSYAPRFCRTSNRIEVGYCPKGIRPEYTMKISANVAQKYVKWRMFPIK